MYNKKGSCYEVKVVDGNGKAAANQDVRFKINGVYYGAKTNSNGIAILSTGLNPGVYTISAENCANGETIYNNVTVLNRIIASDLTLYYNNGSSFRAMVVDGKGSRVPNKQVRFNINGVYYYVNTNDKGVASLYIGLYPNKYIITVEEFTVGELTSFNVIVKLYLDQNHDLELFYNNGFCYTVRAVDGHGNLLQVHLYVLTLMVFIIMQ